MIDSPPQENVAQLKKKLKKLVIFGAGSSGKEIKMLVDEINDKSNTWEIAGFIDKNKKYPTLSDYIKTANLANLV